MTSINLLQVSALGCHSQGVFQIKGIQAQHANLGMHHTHWKDQNIKIPKYIILISIHDALSKLAPGTAII
jgi:hypothetical protein